MQPGANKMSGAHMGKTFASFASRITQGHSPKFTAFGTPVWNRGVALVPATLVGRRDGAALESQGALLLAYHGGKLLEARWFADDVELRERVLRRARARGARCRVARCGLRCRGCGVQDAAQGARQRHAARAVFALQAGTVGDVSGERPGALDMVNRAKFDAWSARKGTAREEAMRAYIELVTKLKADEGS